MKKYQETNWDVEKTLDDLGVEYRKSGKDFCVTCLSGSHDDEHPSLRIDIETGVFHCPVCHYSGNLQTYVAKFLHTTSQQAALRLQSKTLELANREEQILSLKRSMSSKNGKESDNLTLPLHFLPIRQHHTVFLNYLYSRHLDCDMVKKYDIRCCLVGRYNYRVIIPILVNKKLCAFIARDILGKEEREKRGETDYNKFLYPAGAYIGHCVFNYDNLVETEPVYVVEGVFDVFNVIRQGYHNVCGVFGTNITDRQVDLLRKFRRLIVISDQDDGGSGVLVKKVVEKLGNYCEITDVIIPVGKDPGNCDNLKEYIDKAVTIKQELKYSVQEREPDIVKKNI